MNTYKKPIYSIYSRIYSSATVMVNDVPVVDWYGKQTEGRGGYGGDDIINHLLLESGTYEVVGKIYPRNGNKSLQATDGLMMDFYLADATTDNWKASRKQFTPSIETPWDGLSENVEHPYFEIKTKIKVELPFTLNGWQNSVDLTSLEEEELFQDVLKSYYQIHSVLASHNASRFLELSKEKMALQEQAFYFSEERKKGFINNATTLFNQKLEILPIDPGDIKLQIMGYGKLVRLTRKDGTALLQYKTPNPDEQDNVEFDVKLHMRSKEKGLSII